MFSEVLVDVELDRLVKEMMEDEEFPYKSDQSFVEIPF